MVAVDYIDSTLPLMLHLCFCKGVGSDRVLCWKGCRDVILGGMIGVAWPLRDEKSKIDLIIPLSSWETDLKKRLIKPQGIVSALHNHNSKRSPWWVNAWCCLFYVKWNIFFLSAHSVYPLTRHTYSTSTYMHMRYKRVSDIKGVEIEDKVVMIELQSVTPTRAHPDRSKWYWQLNKFSAWNHLSSSTPLPYLYGPLKCNIITLVSRG